MAESDPNQQSRQPSDDELLETAIPIDETADEDGDDDELTPVETEPAPRAGESGVSKIRSFGADQRRAHEEYWKRQPNATGHGAIHVKTFVTKLRLDAIEHMDEQINNWLDNHPEYEVKFVTTSVGKLTGKTTEDALFVNVWV